MSYIVYDKKDNEHIVVEDGDYIIETFEIDNFTIAKGINANSGYFSVQKQGYEAIDIISAVVHNATSGGANSSYCFIYSFDLNSNKTSAIVYMRNTNQNNDAVLRVTVKVLMKKVNS